MRSERIRQAQNEECWITNLKAFLIGYVASLSSEEAKSCAKITSDYDVDESDLLCFCPASAAKADDRNEITRLVVPETLHQDFLHHYHASLEEGH